MTDQTKEESMKALAELKRNLERKIDIEIRRLLDAAYIHADKYGLDLIHFDVSMYTMQYEAAPNVRSIRASQPTVTITYGESV